MKRILIDLTDIEQWSGNHGGTQRVVYGISKNYYLNKDSIDQEVVFIAFRNKQFYEADFTSIYNRVESQKNDVSASNNLIRVSIKSKIKSRIIPYVPELVKRSSLARKSIKKTIIISKNINSKILKTSISNNNSTNFSNQKIIFNVNDTVLIMGKPWDNLDIQSHLVSQKNLKNFKLVQVVYDLIICLYPQLHHPDLFKPYTKNMFEAVSNSDLMLAISESSKNDLIEFCNKLSLPVPKIKVIRLGDEIVNNQLLTEKPSEKIISDFIACIGTVEIRKNHVLLYYAYKLALQRGIDLPQLVIVGSRGWLSSDFQYMVENDSMLKDKIIILDSINDSGLAWIYENCMFTVYPSFYEGWGLPVAESLSYGKFVIASNSSSIPEIAGDLIEYFSPYNAQECLSLICKYLDPIGLNNAGQKIQDNFVATPWSMTAKQVKNKLDGLYE